MVSKTFKHSEIFCCRMQYSHCNALYKTGYAKYTHQNLIGRNLRNFDNFFSKIHGYPFGTVWYRTHS